VFPEEFNPGSVNAGPTRVSPLAIQEKCEKLRDEVGYVQKKNRLEAT
jgi:hypothetical protein